MIFGNSILFFVNERCSKYLFDFVRKGSIFLEWFVMIDVRESDFEILKYSYLNIMLYIGMCFFN